MQLRHSKAGCLVKPLHEVWTRGMRYLALAVIAVLLVSALLPKRWLYRHGRPNRVAQLLNRGWAMAHAAGLWPSRWVTLQVPGRRTGRTISFPLAVADYQGERYLVAMLGEGSSWRATSGRRWSGCAAPWPSRGRAPGGGRSCRAAAYPAPILVGGAGGSSPYTGRSPCPVKDFERIAAQFPVFRVTTDQPASEPAG